MSDEQDERLQVHAQSLRRANLAIQVLTLLDSVIRPACDRQRALQRPRWISARLVLQAVAPSSLHRSVNLPNTCRQRSSVRNKASQYFLSAGAIGCRHR